MINRRRKGSSFEFQVQKWMKERNINFRRITLSGQLLDKKADFEWIENGEVFRGEAKCGSQVPSKLYSWLEKDKADFLVVKRDRKPVLYVLTEKLLGEIL